MVADSSAIQVPGVVVLTAIMIALAVCEDRFKG